MSMKPSDAEELARRLARIESFLAQTWGYRPDPADDATDDATDDAARATPPTTAAPRAPLDMPSLAAVIAAGRARERDDVATAVPTAQLAAEAVRAAEAARAAKVPQPIGATNAAAASATVWPQADPAATPPDQRGYRAPPPRKGPPPLRDAPAPREWPRPIEPIADARGDDADRSLPYATPIPAAGRDALGRPSPGSRGVEEAIGLKLAGWIGAIVLVIGAALGVKFAYDQGWLGGLPDAVKLGLLYAVGLGLIGAGEFVFRRVEQLAAVGLFAAGIALLFVVSYAGNAYYGLYEQHVAFGLMAGACAIGGLISLRGQLASIAVLSLLGANLAPLILRGRPIGEMPLLVYVLALQVMAVGLACVGRGGRWWSLRGLALITTSLWVTGRLFTPATAHSFPTIGFAIVYAVIFQVENLLSARRAPVYAETRFSFATFSLAVTGALTGAVLLWTSHWSDAQRGLVLVAMSMVGFTAGGVGLAVRDANDNVRQLGASWIVQACILLFAAFPVALAGPWLVLGWLSLALGYAVLGTVIRRPSTSLAGVAVWSVSLAVLTLQTMAARPSSSLNATLLTLGGVPLPTWFVLAIMVAVVGHAIALLVGGPRVRGSKFLGSAACEPLSDLVATAATICAAVATFIVLPPLAATVAWVAIAWATLGIHRSSGRLTYAWLGLSLVLLAVAKWVAIDLIGERATRGWHPASRPILFNAPMLVGLLSTASLVAIAWLTGRTRLADASSHGRARERLAAAIAAIVCVTIGLSVEVERTVAAVAARGGSVWPLGQLTQTGWTILWLAAGLLVAPLCRLFDPTPATQQSARRAAGVIAVVLCAKFLAVDAIGFTVAEGRALATPLLNVQTIAALAVMAGLWVAARWNRHTPIGSAAAVACALVPLVIGSIELDRLFGPEKTLVMLSVFWGLFAVGLIVFGFVSRTAALRFAGLGLLGLTLVKIVVMDLANAGTGWRILSFLGVGLILLATSVLYGKLSPIILEQIERGAGPQRGR